MQLLIPSFFEICLIVVVATLFVSWIEEFLLKEEGK